MVKKRTGLQCKISSIFSQAPVPKKGDQSSTSKTSQVSHQEPDPLKSIPSKQKTPTVTYNQPTEFRQRTTSVQVINGKIPKNPRRELAKTAWLKRNKTSGTGTNLNPQRQKIGMVLLFILTCLLVVVLIRNFKTHRPSSPEPVNQPLSQALAKSNIEINWPMPKKYPLNIRDPMELHKEKEKPNLIVRGIVNIEGRLFAIVEGKLVGEGEVVNDVKIIKIDPNNVQFELDGTKWTETKTSNLAVKGIVLGEGSPKALIGIRTVEEGNEFFGATIVRISWGSVEFEMDGKRWTQEVEGNKKRTNDIKSNQ